MSKCGIVFLFVLAFSGAGFAQSLTGNVFDKSQNPLVGATIHWLGTTLHSTSDENGAFQISKTNISDLQLIVSYVGYQSDTIIVGEEQTSIQINLSQGNTLTEVSVEARRQGSYISSSDAIKLEVISEVELSKAACCDLAGCFGTEASVQANTTNIVTNAKELRILGLAGVYNQVLIDGMPLIQGLSYTYGISAIPGTLVKNIYVSKGANSVLQGYESMVGQINVTLKEPDQAERFLFNAYTNSFLEKQFNTNVTHSFKNWSTLFAAHTTQPANRIDQDEDRFLDLPLLTRYSFYNKWKRGNEAEWGFHSKFGLRFLREQRVGGQMDFDPKVDEGKSSVYGQTVEISQPEVYTKTGYRLDDTHHFVFIASAFQQDQKAYFGLTAYKGKQQNFYANLQHEWSWTESNTLKSGLSFRYQQLEETVSFNDDPLDRTYAGTYVKKERIPGVFVENTASWLDNEVVLITGLRLDYHNEFATQITPRALIKYQAGVNTTLRASVGSGWRTINLFSENINLLASSRDVIIADNLEPERTINYGFNIIQKMVRPDYEAWVSLDLYRTRFFNQIFPDYDSVPTTAIVDNFKETSIGNGLKAEVNLELWETFSSKIAYNFLDVYREVDGDKLSLPFIPKHKLIGAFSYLPRAQKWHLDMNVHWYGKQRLANTDNNPAEYQLPTYSDPYVVFNAQFTKSWKRLEIYTGCENIFNFRQERAILSWQDPFGAYFDTASVWGPTRGREFYVGLRYKIPR